MNPEIIKAYLVKLGVQVDTAAFDKMKSLLADIEKAMGKHASSIGMQMTKGAGLVVGAIATIDIAIVKTIEKVAEADMKYQLLAQSMFMNVDAAKAYKMATDTLGASLHQIAWNAELKEQYFRLVKDVNDLKVPQEARDMFRQVRDVGFEFKRSKLLATEFIEHTAFQLLKLNKGGITDLKSFFKNANDNFKKNIPEWSAKLATLFQPFLQIGGSAIEFLKEMGSLVADAGKIIGSVLGDIWSWFPKITKELVVLGGFMAAYVMGGPVLAGMAAISAALLLIDDAMGFKDGKESLEELIPVWEFLEDVINKFSLTLGTAMIAWDHFKHRNDDTYKDLSLGDDIAQFSNFNQKQLEDRRSDRDVKRYLNKQARLKAEAEKNGAVPATTAPAKTGKFTEDMYKSLYNEAVKAGVKNPEVVAQLGVTQSSLETGYGKHAPNHNYFGIKGKGSEQVTQEFINGKMVTKKESFAGYKSMDESAAAYVQFLQKNKRYKGVLEAKDINQAIVEQGKTGYATDPNYGKKLLSVAKSQGYGQHTDNNTLTTAQLQNARKEKFNSMMDKRGNLVSGASRTPVAGPTSVDQRVIVQVDARGATEKDAQAIASKTAEAVKKATVKLAKNEKQNVGIKQMVTATS